MELELGNYFGSEKGTELICVQERKNHLNYKKICKVNFVDFDKCVDKFYKKYQN